MVRILTDSAADFSEELARQLNVEVLPLGVTFEDGMAYRDRVDLQPEEFYEKLAACEKLPKTSQPNLGDVLTAFENARDAGDEMVAIFISSQLSGTYQSACMAADTVEYPGIHVVDSLNATLGEQILVKYALELVERGMSASGIASELERAKAHATVMGVVDTLEYLYKGGRIGKVTAMAGTTLQIKPIITFADDGQLQSVAKVRGRRQVQDKIVDLLRQRFQPGRRYNLGIANGGAPEEMAQLSAKVRATFPDYEHCWEGTMDATLSVYIGNGVIGAGIQFLD